ISERARLTKLSAMFGDRLLHEITAADVQARLFELEDAGLASKTIANYHGLLSVIYKQGKLRQHVGDNPMEKVPRPKVVPRNEVTALSEIEVERLLRYPCPERPVIMLLIHTGLRMGELVRVRVERDVDFEANVLVVRSVEGAATKNRKPRTIPLTPAARATLAGIRVGPVVGMTRWGLEKRLQKIGRELGFKVNAHRLRHTFCSLNMANGVPEPVVQRWLGHGSATITRRYTHLSGHDQRWATLSVGEKSVCSTGAVGANLMASNGKR
ncbi:MAG TPA: site-specific integrase, partial [Elusimicrobiales bacterium]|nr:site-specific integrase [Elusimicrobiales bacterium]